jgi:hypothetical protein
VGNTDLTICGSSLEACGPAGLTVLNPDVGRSNSVTQTLEITGSPERISDSEHLRLFPLIARAMSIPQSS